MRLKNKTMFRKLIKSSFGITKQLDNIEFFSDGDWEVISNNTIVKGIFTKNMIDIIGDVNILNDYNTTIDQSITKVMKDLEKEIGRYYGEE